MSDCRWSAGWWKWRHSCRPTRSARSICCATFNTAPAAITLADLPPSLATRYVGRSGKWLLRVFAKDCLWDHEPLEQFVRQASTVDPEATGKPFGTLEGLKELKNGFEWAGLYALAAI